MCTIDGPNLKIETAPIYASLRSPSVHHTMGGLKIDGCAHVISTDGEIIAGLYAGARPPAACTAPTALAATASRTPWPSAASPWKPRWPNNLKPPDTGIGPMAVDCSQPWGLFDIRAGAPFRLIRLPALLPYSISNIMFDWAWMVS